MSECQECRQLSRRGFLAAGGKGLGALAFAHPLLSAASTFGQTASGTGNLLVLCELNGGLDALSFLAPFTSSVYRAKRPLLALGADRVTPLPDNPDYGIHQLLPTFSDLYAQNQVAIVQQVGYPGSNGSHFESQEIFEFGMRDLTAAGGAQTSWYERLRKLYFDEPYGVLDTKQIGDPSRYGYPDRSYRRAAEDSFGRLASMTKARNPIAQAMANAYGRIDARGEEIRTRTEGFESGGESRGEFYRGAALASADLDTQILRLTYGGFDTHGDQETANAQLFPTLNDEFAQFVGDMQSMGLWDRTIVCFYTEFGRRNEENGSPGTDHGHGGHMILVGPGVNGGLHGQRVTDSDMNEDSLPYYVDFRAVFGACIRDWLGFDPKPVFEMGQETYDDSVGSALFT